MIDKSNMAKILVVDDDKRLCNMLKRYLEEEGNFKVKAVHSGEDALDEIEQIKPDVIILDLMLPGKDGIETCREIIKITTTPIIMLTAKGNPTDKVIGLEVGSDDYLAKPFEPRELLARCKSLLRRGKINLEFKENSEIMTFDDIEINTITRNVVVKGNNVQFTSYQFDIIKLFAQKAGRVLSRDYILDNLLGRQFEAFDRSIDVHISNIRKKLAKYGQQDRIITKRGTGYIFKKLLQNENK